MARERTGASPIDRRPPAWPLLGLALVVLWSCFLLKPLDALAPASFEAFYAAQGATMLAAAAFSSRRKADPPPLLDYPFALAMFLSPFIAQFPHPVFHEASLLAGGILGGCSWSWFLARWFSLYTQLPTRFMLICLMGAHALMPLLRLPLEFVPLTAALAITAIVPIVIVPLLRRASLSISEARAAQNEQSEREPLPLDGSNLRTVIGELVVYGVAVGLFRINADTASLPWQLIVAGLAVKSAIPLILLWLVWRARGGMSLNLVCQIGIVFILIAVSAASSQWQNPPAAFAIFDCMRHAVYILLTLALAALTQQTRTRPAVVFGVGWGSYTAAVFLGMLAADALGTQGVHAGTLAVQLVCILAVTTILAFTLKDDLDMRLFSTKPPEEPPPIQNFEELDRRCEALARERDLTSRELDVMKLICRGRSKRYIAEHLIISENTVRSYAKSLYRKLDIHSRQELMSAIGLEEE